VYSKFHSANFIAGVVEGATGQIRAEWTEGLANVYDFWTNVAFDTVDNILEAWARFFVNGNMQDANIIVTDSDVDVVSDATHLHTVPANTADKLIHASVRNTTRAPTCSLALTPNGGTASIFNMVGGTVIGQTVVLYGGSAGGIANYTPMKGPTVWQAGDTWELSIDNFVAADAVRKEFIFERYTPV
jgi:hypothetical protein